MAHSAGLTVLQREVGAAHEVSSLALRRLCTTRPTTVSGMKALIEYLRPLYESDGLTSFYDDRGIDLFKTLAAAVPKLRAV
jgi:hypothetical protein